MCTLAQRRHALAVGTTEELNQSALVLPKRRLSPLRRAGGSANRTSCSRVRRAGRQVYREGACKRADKLPPARVPCPRAPACPHAEAPGQTPSSWPHPSTRPGVRRRTRHLQLHRAPPPSSPRLPVVSRPLCANSAGSDMTRNGRRAHGAGRDAARPWSFWARGFTRLAVAVGSRSVFLRFR